MGYARAMPALYTMLPGQPMAALAARHVLAQWGERLPECVLLLPTRRACSLMRIALIEALEGRTVLLPRILPLGDLEAELPGLVPHSYLEQLASVPPAMPEWRRLGLLMRQVIAFERGRQGDIAFPHALGLATDLAALQDQCAREGVPLTMERLRQLDIPAHYAEHWESSLAFLSIVAATWPDIEREEGSIAAASRQLALLGVLAEAWESTPPTMPVIAIGSTASQPATARLLRAVAAAPHGSLLLPGLDPRITAEAWACVAPGHPLYHIKTLLDGWGMHPADVALLGEEAAPSIWLEALTCSEEVAGWRRQPPSDYQHLRLIETAHGEEEARVLAVLIHEGLEQGKRTALVTPDEGLMQRVGAHLARYGVTPDRMKQGHLAATETGSLWLAMLQYVANPARVLPLLALLRHPLLVERWDAWLAEAEPHFRGLVQHQPGQLPRLAPALRERPEHAAAAALVRGLAALYRRRFLPSQWIEHLTALAASEGGQGAEAMAEALDALGHADILGEVDADGFTTLLSEALAEPWRGGIHQGHPGIAMLTPVEARLQRFDRVLLANMQDVLWPGLVRPSAWLNLAQRQQLGLPSPEEHASLMAHDVLLLGSHAEVFFTWPAREQGSPTTRSRFIERLVAYLAVHGVAESTLHAPHYLAWAARMFEAERYAPAAQPMPRPAATRRPTALAVSALDHLVTDPYWLYARYVLRLRELDPIDAEPEARELGTLVHEALKQLTDHWNEHHREATDAERAVILQRTLAPFEARPEARLFWQQRLARALAFVNGLEADRRASHPTVAPEREVNHALDLGEQSLTLLGRIDRLETGAGGLRIGDYKTGEAPTAKDILNGNAMQLLAYAMLLEIEGQPIAGLDYWQLPAGRRPGQIHALDGETLAQKGLTAQLHQLITDFMDPASALLARPYAQKDRYPNPYDGISRYDEWAS